MRFAPTDDQNDFVEAVSGLLADTCTPDAVRSAWGGAVGRHTGLGDSDGRVRQAWDALTEMGVCGLMVPEAQGGLAMTDDDLVGIVIECGRAGLPDPIADTAGVAAAALGTLAGAGDETAASWLERIAGGATVVVGFGPSPLLSGAPTADAILLLGHDPVTGTGEHTVDLFEAGSVELSSADSVDGSRNLSQLHPGSRGATRLAEGATAEALVARAFDRAAVLDAALLVGLSARMLDITIEYVGERKQFGTAIGTFQAVKHHLADASLGIEFAEPLVRNAAHFMALGEDAAMVASMAKQRASLAAVAASEATLQCHGAIGYTVEADLHLFMKRAWALARSHGDADWHRARVRSALLAG
ncbi:MAG: acyl-CoA/acyl-ACP dehydrogenase [Actinomycetia bacterium]|nr:acyl-CoA/acyl-ACP dehydrogenase [Actinomycetes bacterium]